MPARRTQWKYEPLRAYLAAQPGARLTLSFSQIQALVRRPLPASAWLRQWWTNSSNFSSRPQSQAWLTAGWRVAALRSNGRERVVRFVRQPPP